MAVQAGSIVRAAIAAAADGTNEMANLMASTRNQFRRRTVDNDHVVASSPTRRRGRRSFACYKKKVFIMKLAHANFLPAFYEQAYLKQRGLGKQEQQLEINRTWTMEQIKNNLLTILNTNISDLLRMADFNIARIDKQKKLHIISNINNGVDLERKLKKGLLVIVPLRDFPDDLPILNETDDVSSLRPATNIIRSISPMPLPNELEVSLEESDGDGENEQLMLPSTSNTEMPVLQEDAQITFVNVSRYNIYNDMIDLYSDPIILQRSLSVRFIGEAGVDAGGLTMEFFTLFWKTLFSNSSHYSGHDIKIPHLPLHLINKKRKDFVIFGRILSHSLLLTRNVPTKLAKYTVVALSERDPTEYKSNLLLKEYMAFLTPPERKLVAKGLKNFLNLSEREKLRLQQLFMSNNFMDIPRPDNFEEQVLLIAEKVIVKDPAELYMEIKNGITEEMIKYFQNMSIDAINDLWSKMKPTAEKVMNCLVLTCEYVTNMEERTYFYLQNYVGSLNDEDLANFLLFTTGSINMPDTIKISFHKQNGLGRRPIAHTCSNLLELADNFDTQQEFNFEFAKFLNNENTYEYDQV